MPNLGEIYRDINSTFAQYGIDQTALYSKDTTNLINDTIASLRIEYIQNGLGHEFSVTETISNLTADTNYPFLQSDTLTNTLLRALPIQWTVRQSVFQATNNELTDTLQTWSAGDLAIKDKVVYRALSDVANANTYDLTFEVENVRNFRVNNGFKYKEGDIAYDGSIFVRFTEDYTNNISETIAEVPAEELVWRREQNGYWEGTYVPFDRLHELKLDTSIYVHYPFSIKEDTIYTPIDNLTFTISYIPEWTYIEDLSTEIKIPDSMVRAVKDTVIARLANKLQIQINQEQDESR